MIFDLEGHTMAFPLSLIKPIRQLRNKNLNTPPGSLKSSPEAQPTTIDLLSYHVDDLEEHQNIDMAKLKTLLKEDHICWVQITGLKDIEVIKAIGELFDLHPLALEDVLSIPQRAKQEDFGDYIYTVCHMFHDRPSHLQMEQISIFLTGRAVITFQEFEGDCFEPLRLRIRQKRGRIRQQRHDYLFYSILDAITDHYFPILEKHGEILDALENKLFEHFSGEQEELQELMGLRRALLAIRRVLWPLRDTIHYLSREPHQMISEDVRVYFRDCHDHTLRLIDLLETYREMNAHLKDVSLNLASQRLNEVMKVLTIISTIFIPLSFLAGLYGMNFDQKSPYNMPELKWAYGYPTLLLVMLVITCILVGYFVKKGWLFQGSKS